MDTPFLDKNRWNNATKCMCVKVEGIDIINLHGAWQPKSKKQDTPERLIQSRILRNLSKGKEHKTVLIGDFNLMPDTESVRLLEKKYTNLIIKYGIKSTRTAVYDDVSLPFADYAFAGSDLEVSDFQVHLEPIFSDHGFMTLGVSRP
jgi:endonuclease/exonuclease/phosphatase family metal-dependent hydrolase